MKQFFVLVFFFSSFFLKAQSISIQDIDLKAGYLNNQNDDNSFSLFYKVSKRSATSSFFKKIDFNELLTVSDTTEITIPGNYRPLSSAKSERFEIFCFGSVQNGDIVIAWLDLETGSQHQTRLQRTLLWSKRHTVNLTTTRDPEVFCVIHQLDKNTTEVQFIKPKGKGEVKSVLTGKKLSLKKAYLSEDKIILDVATQTQNEKKLKHRIIALDGYTGKQLYATQLSDKGNMLRADQIRLLDSTLYFLGARYATKKMNLNKDGIPVLVKVNLNQGTVADTPIRVVPPHCFWVDLVQSPDGSLYGIGETFTSGSFGAYFAKAMATAVLTLGIVSVTWNTMHFRDVVLVNIEDPVTKPEVIKLKHKRIQIGGHIPAYSFASYSFRTGQSRYFGTNGSEVYLLNEREMIVQSIDSKESRILGKVQSEIQPRAFDIGSNRALYLRQMNMQRTLDLQIVRFLAP